MGKRSRARSGPVKGMAARPSASQRAAAAAETGPDAGPVQRAKASWRAAGDAAPSVVRERGQKPRIDKPRPSSARGGGARARRAAEKGDRPAALWGTAPISEFAIAVGLILVAVGFARGPGSPAITGGLVFITIAVIEYTAREHVRGYRSHTLFISMMVVIAVHLGIATVVGAHTARGPAFVAGDVVLFGLLASGLHKQFSIARAERAAQRSR